MSNSQRRGGFTLAEALITTLLVGSVFFVVSDLLNGALRAMRFESYKTASERAARVALQRLVADSEEAISVTTGSGTYVVQKIDASIPLTEMFPDGASTFSPTTYLCNVTYSLTDGTLYRQATSYNEAVATASSAPLSIATQLNSFATSYPADSYNSHCMVQITLSLQEADMVQAFNSTVWLPTSHPNP